MVEQISPTEALQKLKDGNRRYFAQNRNGGDASAKIRRETCQSGQHPYAIIIGCSDLRAIETVENHQIPDLFPKTAVLKRWAVRCVCI